jgi:hypothetical protein
MRIEEFTERGEGEYPFTCVGYVWIPENDDDRAFLKKMDTGWVFEREFNERWRAAKKGAQDGSPSR